MDEKLKILKSIRELECKGIQFDQVYSMESDIDELKFVVEIHMQKLRELETANKIKQIVAMSLIVLDQINPEAASPFVQLAKFAEMDGAYNTM